ncbi:IS66 family insertion sequence element accessory protein TnpA [Tenacibaculum maritimum]|uniref:IS66 family insertion sequence element accessory protein TnpA n=1 Tax=Tenacibaculum maritimum TaxID=107401 RepID=UPI00132FA4C4|nr:transposase [Tenacibaculum maritimum]
MYPLIEGFTKSGKTVREYANSLGMKYGTYKYWVRKYRADQKKSPDSSVPQNFIPIKVANEKIKAHDIAIVYPNGVELSLTSSLDTLSTITLKRIISCLD